MRVRLLRALGALVFLLAGCGLLPGGGAGPAGNLPPSGTAPPTETSSATLSPTATSTPSPTPTLHPLTIESMRQREYPGSEIVLVENLAAGSNYARYIVSYQSEGLAIRALLTVPLGAKPATGQVFDGVSLLPVFKGGTLPDRALFWHYPHYGNQGGAPGAAIRRGDWKLIEWFEDGRAELFNLAADLGETKDLAAQEPQRVAQMRAELQAWQKEVGAKFPAKNPNHDPGKPDGRVSNRKRP